MENISTAKILVTIFFVALLATPAAIDRFGDWESGGNEVGKQESLKRYGFYLEEVSGRVGINFEHEAPEVDPKINHIERQIASVGASVSVADYNNDGWQDIYLTKSRQGTRNALFRNNGDGSFTDVAESMGLATLNSREKGVSMGSVWGDYDNDGYEDLLVYKWGKPVLFHNDEGKGFTEVSGKAGLPGWMNANTAVWFDYNRDGLLDIFLGGYYREELTLWDLDDTYIMPDSYEYATNGARNYLYRNEGDGTFKEVSEQSGLTSRMWTFSASAVDLNDSGYPDLVIANDYGVDELYINRGGEKFVEQGNKAGMGFSPKSGMNVSFGDILNQGKEAIYITNISEPGILIQGNNLWMPEASSGNEVKFRNMAGSFGIELGGWSYGAQFGDLNNDGHLDLYVANGFVSGKEGTDYWYDYSKISGGHENIISDARNWPPMEGRSHSGYQENKIWLNDGAGKFQEVAGAVGASLNLDSRAVALADLWNNGTLDIVVSTQNGPVQVYRNTTTDHHWIGFRLVGTKSNRSAIGAEVELFWNGKSQVQTVSGGSGFSAQSQRPIHFGLGTAENVEKAVIRWPMGGRTEIENPDINKRHTVEEESR